MKNKINCRIIEFDLHQAIVKSVGSVVENKNKNIFKIFIGRCFGLKIVNINKSCGQAIHLYKNL